MCKAIQLLLIAAESLVPASAALCQDYPSRPVTVVVPYPPGTNADVIARLLTDKLARGLKQTFVVENRAGAATVPATASVLQAPADGHTLLESGTATNINQLLGVKTAYDAERDLAPVVLLVTFPGVLVLNPSVPAANIDELIALAKSKPGILNYGSPGIGSFAHLAMEQLNQLTGIRITHVPFRGLGPTMTGLLRDDVQMMISDIPGSIEHIRSGKLRALAQTGLARMPQLPDLPTLAEAGLSGYEASGFLGIWVRAGTPPEATAVLNQEMNRALASPEISKYATNDGLKVAGGTAADFAAFLKRDRAIWSRVIGEGGIKAD
jgi:tripartite-type tricarboxylate transporter receptor subunit TctC